MKNHSGQVKRLRYFNDQGGRELGGESVPLHMLRGMLSQLFLKVRVPPDVVERLCCKGEKRLILAEPPAGMLSALAHPPRDPGLAGKASPGWPLRPPASPSSSNRERPYCWVG